MDEQKPVDQDEERIKKIVYIAMAVIVALIVLIIIAAASAGSNTNNTSESATRSETTKSEASSDAITQHDAEKYCQDASLLNAYISDDTSIVTLGYSPTFTDLGSNQYSLQWSGKNDNGSVLFVCDISGTADNITLDNLAINGESVYSKQ